MATMNCMLCGTKLTIPDKPTLGDYVVCPVCKAGHRYIKAGKDIIVRKTQ